MAPPLKSTSTRFSSADECVAANPSTRVRSSSLLPDPVAPMQSPCGPLPPCADSLMSSATGAPVSSRPIGTRSRSASRRRSAQRRDGGGVDPAGPPREAEQRGQARGAARTGRATAPEPAGR